jgi:4-amino-4-deoxy-L-arabinose transferase-like glycosyltransferase
MVDGHLPYVGLYDLKPPLLFAFFAAVIAVAGKSVVAIRFAGMLCVAAVACFTYNVGRRVWNARVGGIAGFLYVVATAVVAGARAQATMSEIVALVPLMASLVVLLRNPGVTWSLFAAGCLISLAGLVRSNLVVVAVGIAIWVILNRLQRSAMDRARDVLAYGIGVSRYCC